MHDYLALKFEFPDYYGKNLDGLYDLLTESREDICVGVFGLDRAVDLRGGGAARHDDALPSDPHVAADDGIALEGKLRHMRGGSFHSTHRRIR